MGAASVCTHQIVGSHRPLRAEVDTLWRLAVPNPGFAKTSTGLENQLPSFWSWNTAAEFSAGDGEGRSADERNAQMALWRGKTTIPD